MPTEYTQTLIQAGLNKNQALVYEALLQNGVLPAGKLAVKTPLKRSLVYKILEELAQLGLVLKKEIAGKPILFEPAHPLKLKELAEIQERRAKDAQLALETTLGGLISSYNLATGKPGIQFFEGKEGVKKALEDSLTAKSEICSYADIDAIVKYINEINRDYVKKRERLNIKKRGIVRDTKFARDYLSKYYPGITATRLLPCATQEFQSIMQIYDDKISYITLNPNALIGVIVTNQEIARMHAALFSCLWEKAAPLIVSTNAPANTPPPTPPSSSSAEPRQG